MTADTEPATLRDRAERAAVEAAELVRTRRRRGLGPVATKSSATDPVTEVDRAAEALIVERLLTDGPDDAVLGEEAGSRPGRSGVRWIVDPIDGTVNFVYGIPAYAVSIAAEVAGEVVAGVVVDVEAEATFRVAAGRGAAGPDGPLAVTDVTDPARALIGTGFGYRPEQRREQARVLTHLLPSVRDIRRSGSAALDLCAVAAGRLDGFYEVGLAPWDVAAGGALVTASGGAVRTFTVGDGGETTLTVAAGPGLIDPLVDLLGRAGAPTGSV